MSRPYDQEVRAALERAREALDAAHLLAEQGLPDSAASRAYYAAFHAATAALLQENEAFKTHSTVLSAFHRLFVKTGRVDVEHGKALNQLFELRGVGDYGALEHVRADEAQYAVNASDAFVSAVREVMDDG